MTSRLLQLARQTSIQHPIPFHRFCRSFSTQKNIETLKKEIRIAQEAYIEADDAEEDNADDLRATFKALKAELRTTIKTDAAARVLINNSTASKKSQIEITDDSKSTNKKTSSNTDADSDSDSDSDSDTIELNLEETEENFPRLGWSPGSFGAAGERPSRMRKPGQSVGRSGKPAPTEDEVWFKNGLYDEYNIKKREAKDNTVDKK